LLYNILRQTYKYDYEIIILHIVVLEGDYHHTRNIMIQMTFNPYLKAKFLYHHVNQWIGWHSDKETN